jgi:phosphate starvation-inducible PhoH-like protein
VPRRKNKDNAKRAYRPHPAEVHFKEEEFSNCQKVVEIIPRNKTQYDYLEALRDEENYIIFALGPAGTGKTKIATEYAIEQYQLGNVDKIIITRPAVSVDEEHGFLPGGLLEKMAPWVIPIMDVFKEHFGVPALEKMLRNEVIEVSPLAYTRGRTFKNAIVIADEMQNATTSQMMMLLTRIGDGSKMVVTGDLAQHDRGYEENGLKDFVRRLDTRGSDSIEIIEFQRSDVVRHPVVQEVLEIYGED